MFWNQTATHRSTHIVDGKVVDTTTITKYDTPDTDTFKYKMDEPKQSATGSVIVNKSGDDSDPKPSWGFTLS